MSAIKFNHVFAGLLIISALSAFVIPERYTTKIQPQIQGLFQPVAKPTRAIAAWVSGRVEKPDPNEKRTTKELLEEIDVLRQDYMAAMHALEEAQRRALEIGQLGSLAELCTPVRTVGGDIGNRDSLALRGTTFDGLKQGQFVVSPRGIVGILERAPGMAGSQVRLITDPGVRIEGYFAIDQRDAEGHTGRTRLPLNPKEGDPPLVPLVQGVGKGAMQCVSLTMEQVKAAGVREGTWVLLQDKDWDERLHGRALGKVVHIAPQAAAPLYADIRIQPVVSLSQLREVMVLTK
jgi:hypothetical protein